MLFRLLSRRPTGLLPGGTLVVLLAVLLAGCAANSNKPVEPGMQDTSGRFDGQWTAHVAKPATTQGLGGNWQQTCTAEPYTWDFSVNESQAQIQYGDMTYTTPVSGDGRFVFLMPTDYSTGAAPGTMQTLGDGSITRILRGQLAEGKRSGHHVWGVAQFGNDGCTSKVTYTQRQVPG